jgi:hypothetical protein
MPINTRFSLNYQSGVAYSVGGKTRGGWMRDVQINSDGLGVTDPTQGPLFGGMDTGLFVSGPTVTAQATVPAGADIEWSLGNRSGTLKEGVSTVSIPTGVSKTPRP